MTGPSPTSRASLWEWTQALLLSANLAWTTLCLGGFLAETMVVTSVLTGLLLAVHFGGRALGCGTELCVHPAGWVLVPFLAYAAANAAWVTPVHWLGWRDWLGWAQMLGVFWVVLNGVRNPGPRRTLLVTLASLGVVAVALGCYQRFVNPTWLMLGREQADQFVTRASGCFGIPNSMAALLLLVLPAAGAVALIPANPLRWRGAAGGLTLVLAFGLFLTISRGAWLSLAGVLVAWPLATGRWSWRRRLTVSSVALGAIVLLGAGLYRFSPPVRERLANLVRDYGELSRPILWRAGWKLFREAPALGTGAGSFNVLFEKHRPEGFALEPVWAHNDYLNTLSDYGAVGFVLFFGACVAIGWRCVRQTPPAGAAPHNATDSPAFTGALAAGMVAFALQLFVDFHFKIPALAMAFATVGALLVQQRWSASKAVPLSSRRIRVTYGMVAAGCVAGTAFFATPRYAAEALRHGARRAIDRLATDNAGAANFRAVLPSVRVELNRAVALDPANAQAWADLSYVASLVQHGEPERQSDAAWVASLGREAELAAGRALALTSASGEYFIRRGVARDMQRRWLEASEDFAQAITLTPTRSLAWYYYAYHLTLDSRGRMMTDAALAFCLRLDPSNAAGLALRQHLAISRKAP